MSAQTSLPIPIRILTPIGMLGYGFDAPLNRACLSSLSPSDLKATALIMDSGSTDSGPGKLAFGTTTCPRSSYKRDIGKLLDFVHEFRIPLIVSSAGGDGSNAHVDLFVEIVWEIERERYSSSSELCRPLKVISIHSEIPKALISSRWAAGQIRPCGAVPELLEEDILDCPTIVGQMGPEPFLDAMVANPDFDVIIGGRAYDPSPYVAYSLFKTFEDPQAFIESANKLSTPESSSIMGGFYHMGKIMECGALCSVPKSHSALATMYANGVFDVVPLSPKSICTPVSVAAHTLYEKSRPDILNGPGGELDLTKTTYEALDDGRSVRARGAEFRFSRVEHNEYTLKLEGAKIKGFRTMFQGGIRDPILISQIDNFLSRVKEYAESQHPRIDGETWSLEFHVFGRNGVMGHLEPQQKITSNEVFIVGEVLASTQELATAVASSGRVSCAHGSYPGQLATGGNLGFGLGGKLEIELGPCAEFAIYHLMQLERQEENGHGKTPMVESKRIHSGLFHFAAETRQSGVEKTEVVKEPAEHVLVTAQPSLTHLSTNGHTNGHTNGLTNGHTNGLTDGHTIGLTDGHTNGLANGHTNGLMNGQSRSTNHSQPESSSTPSVKASYLRDIAKVIRSKNSGPFEITLDIMFSTRSTYELVKTSNILSRQVISELYRLPESEIITCMFFDQAMAFKATIPRKGPDGKPRASGGYFESDVQGSQQHAPLLTIELSEGLAERLEQASNT